MLLTTTAIIKSNGKVLFVDSGYACYEDEMLGVFRKIFSEFDTMEKTVLVTHADVDHCGLLPLFDKVIASKKTANCLINEYHGRDGLELVSGRFSERTDLRKTIRLICKFVLFQK